MRTGSRGARRLVAGLTTVLATVLATTAPGSATAQGVLDVRSSSAPRLTGVLLDPVGAPLVGWTAQVGSSRATSAADGAFDLPMTALGDRLHLVAPAVADVPYFVLDGVPMSTTADLDLGQVTVPMPAVVTAEVVDAHGRPVSRAFIGDGRTVDLMDESLGWVDAGSELAPGIGISAARWEESGSTGADGKASLRIPATSDGGLVALPVSFANFGASGHGSTADAVRLPDGSYRVVLPDLEIPPLPAAPANLHARPADGAAYLSWNPSSNAQPHQQYRVTNQVDGTTTVVTGTTAVVPAVNDRPQWWTVQGVTSFDTGVAATSETVVPRRLTLTLSGPAAGAVVTGSAAYAVTGSVPFTLVGCTADPVVVVERCGAGQVRFRSGGHPGLHTISATATDLTGNAVVVTRTYVEPTPITFLGGLGRSWQVRCCVGHRATTTRRGAVITFPRVRGDRMQAVMTTGPGQGVVDVWSRGHRIRRIDLSRMPAATRTVLPLTPTRLSGQVRIRVVSSGRPVTIYGFAATS